MTTHRLVPLVVLALACGNDKGVSVYNTAPSVSLVQPVDGAEYEEGEAITFEARVDDDQTAPEELEVSWSSDVDGVLDEGFADASGLSVFVTGDLSPDDHVVQVTVVDGKALSATDWVTVTVLDLEDQPTITVRSPSEGDSGVEEEAVDFEVVVSDEQDDPASLYVWVESDLDGLVCEPAPDASGLAECAEVLSVGEHQLTFGVEDSSSAQATVSFAFEVLAWTAIDDDGDGYTEDAGDCDDTNSSVYPGATEYYNDTDDDCDGVVDEGTVGYDDDGDGFTELEDDCDDADDTVYPDAPEGCDGVDNDCDGDVDEGTDCVDDDGDGYSEGDGDCDDADADTYPDAPELEDGIDNDCDGVADEGTDVYDDDGDCYCEIGPCTGSAEAACTTLDDGDCDDAEPAVNPAATETCDYVDNDCDGRTDEGVTSTYYADADRDGYGDASSSTTDCSAPTGYVTNDDDCDDTNSSVNPSRTETCNGVDDDCDGTTDGSSATDASTYYRDADGDGYGSSTSTKACSAPTGYVTNSSDCDDSDSTVYPYATETCNSTDDDCDGSTDEGVTSTYYRDSDGDGYGDPSKTTSGCSAPSGYVSNANDCDDTDSSLNPNTVWYLDYDGDGYGGGSVTTKQCTQPSGYVSNATDCNDSAASAYPGATESCDGIDNDCDGTSDEINASGCSTYYYDYDGDSYGSSSVSGRCYCSATGYYTASNDSDCYDSNANANPAATTYYTSSRGDGSYDYNCDGSESKYYTSKASCTYALGDCEVSSSGWETSSSPSCGSTKSWSSTSDDDGCSWSWSAFSCEITPTTTNTQKCR